MKKIFYYVTILLVASFTLLNNVSAATYPTQIYKGDEVPTICRYKNGSKSIHLLMTKDDDGGHGYAFSVDGEILTDGLDFYSMEDDSKIQIQDSIDFGAFECPNNLYMDYSAINEVCLDNDGSYCKDHESFNTNYDDYFSLNYSFTSTINDISEEYINTLEANREELIESIKNGEIEDTKLLIEKSYEHMDEKLALYYDNEGLLPSFIVGDVNYFDFSTKLEDFYDELIIEAGEVALDEDNLTEEEEEEIKSNIDLLKEANEISKRQYIEEMNSNMYDISNYEQASCSTLLGDVDNEGDVAYWLNLILDIMKYAAIVALVGLTIVDFLQATASSDGEAVKKVTNKTVKRFVYTIVIFFVPILLNLILEMIGITGDCPILDQEQTSYTNLINSQENL